MKLKFVLFLFLGLTPVFSYAQGCLTVFSEDGDKFYLVLNGIRQNPMPQTNVRVDGLNNDFYTTKIIFEDGTKPEISKTIPVKDQATSQFAEVTYKIKRTKDGELKLRYAGATPVPVNYTPPPDMYVMHYGEPAPATTVSQTTVTTTTTGQGQNGSVSFGTNMGGGSVGFSVPAQSTTTQQTTTTTTTTSGNYSTTDRPYERMNAQPSSAGCQYPMDHNSFNSAKGTVANASFEDTKFSTAKSILSANCVSTDQVIALCKLFGFEQTKLDFAKFAYSKTIDQGNYFKVSNVFGFDASKEELNTFISNGGK